MGPIRAEIEIDAPRERVFEVVSDLGLRQSFTDHFISDLRLSRIESTGVGAAARFRFSVPPQALWMETQISRVEAPHRLSERGRGGRGNRLVSRTEWELNQGSGTMMNLMVVYWTEPDHPLDRVKEIAGASSVWYRRDWQEALRRLRDMIESGAPDGERVRVAGGNRQPTGIP